MKEDIGFTTAFRFRNLFSNMNFEALKNTSDSYFFPYWQQDQGSWSCPIERYEWALENQGIDSARLSLIELSSVLKILGKGTDIQRAFFEERLYLKCPQKDPQADDDLANNIRWIVDINESTVRYLIEQNAL